MTDRDYTLALPHCCPFCGAKPGDPCVYDPGRTQRVPLNLPHYSRMPDSPDPQEG